MHKFFSILAPARRKKPTRVHTGRSQLHDHNEDILRIIKLYNQGTIKTINDDAALSRKKYPILLKYRASNVYISFVAALGIFSSIYMNCSLSAIQLYANQNQINNNSLNNEKIRYLSSCFYFSGILGGSMFFGWLGCVIRQRKTPILIGMLSSFLACISFMVSSKMWFPVRFLQGISNASIWIFSAAMITDIYSLSKREAIMGLMAGIFPSSMIIGLSLRGNMDHSSFHSAFVFCAIVIWMQSVVIERATIPEEWIIPASICLDLDSDLDSHIYKDMQRDTFDVVERNSWSKSSSMSTINYRDQPFLSEKQRDAKSIESAKQYIRSCALFRVLTSIDTMTHLYQLTMIASVLGSLKYALAQQLKMHMHVTNPVHHAIIQSAFLFPFAISLCTGGWFCGLFGVKTVNLVSAILCIPAFIWAGIPNQKLQLLVSALSVCGFLMGGMTMGISVSASRAIQNIQLQNWHDLTKRQEKALLKEQSTFVFATISTMFSIGLFLGLLISEVSKSVRFLWVCFSYTMLIATFIPLMALYPKNSKLENNGSKRLVIWNNTQAENFDLNITDDESTLGSTSNSVRSVALESKPSSTFE